MKLSTVVGKVISACVDDQHMLEHASRTVDARRRLLLDRLAANRADFVEEACAFTGREPARDASWAELGRELGLELRVAVGGRSNGDMIAACRRSCRRTGVRIDAALDSPLPEALRILLVETRMRLESDDRALVGVLVDGASSTPSDAAGGGVTCSER